jgi:hypothetical protein
MAWFRFWVSLILFVYSGIAFQFERKQRSVTVGEGEREREHRGLVFFPYL